jgi:DNA-directed RNA polymerase subunit K/omega
MDSSDEEVFNPVEEYSETKGDLPISSTKKNVETDEDEQVALPQDDDLDDDDEDEQVALPQDDDLDDDDEDDQDGLPEDEDVPEDHDDVPGDQDDVPDGDETKKTVSDTKEMEYLNTDSEEYSDDESDYDEEAFQKLEKEISSEYLINAHPELEQPSYNEVLAFSKIIRNDKGIIIDPLHKTVPYVTKFEYARIIGVRTKQLNNGADPFIDIEPDIIDGYTIALKEFEQKKIPFIICRPLPNGGKEYWRLADLEIVHF